MLVSGALMLFVVAGLVLRLHFMRVNEDVLHGPHLHDRIEALLTPYEGQALSEEALRELERAANDMFRDAITGVGLIPNDWSVVLELDDVLGAVAKRRGPRGRTLGVSEFEQQLRDGTIELPSL